jgi:hypothetical protein
MGGSATKSVPAYTLLRPGLDRRRAPLLNLWLQPQAGKPVQASLDRHLISDPRPADVPEHDSWLGTHDPQNSAMGFTGEPVPPTTRRGATMSMNSYLPSSVHASARGCNNALSSRPMPYAKMAPCTDQGIS